MASEGIDGALELTTTTVALITTKGKAGPNVMAAEWTMMASYNPPMVLVVINPHHATYRAIEESGEFGVNWCSEEQVALSNFSGSFSRREVDKLSSEIFEIYPARRIGAPMLKGCIATMECRLVKTTDAGDHTVFLGEVVEGQGDPTKRPLVLHRGYHVLGPTIPKARQVTVAVTPAGVGGDAGLDFAGRVTGPGPGGPVTIRVLDGGGVPLITLETHPDGDGYFEALSRSLPPGNYRVVAEAMGTKGEAMLRV